MIEKIIKLRGIGLLHEPLPDGEIELKKITSIYAENGRGKSTLATIFRSLAEGDPVAVLSKKTLGGEYDPLVMFRINNQNYVLENGNWTANCPHIIVFDSDFIDKNVYSGSRLEPEHRANLLEFALGEQGVSLKKEIDNINTKISEINSELRNMTKLVEAYAQLYNPREFINLQPDPQLEEKLRQAEKRLMDVKNVEAIKKRPELITIELPQIEIEQIKELLQKSIETLMKEAEQQVRKHIKQYLDQQGEQWLRQGLKYTKGGVCPFCTQSLKGVSIIEAYKCYFDQSYEELKGHIEEQKKWVAGSLSDSRLTSIIEAIKRNSMARESWSDQPDVIFPPEAEKDEIEHTWRKLREELLEVLGKKLENPLLPVPLPESLSSAFQGYKQLQDKIRQYNSEINSANQQLQTIKQSIESMPLKVIEEQIAKLKAQKKRWEPEVDELCNKYRKLQDEKSGLEQDKNRKKNELDQYTNSLLRKYKDSINEILETFYANFSIEETSVDYKGGRPRISYRLRLMGKTIPVMERDETAGSPLFSNVLSDGDKRTLALAFFLARLYTEPELNRKIVVIDDPISSFDTHRRQATLKALIDLGKKCSQLIVLSHDAFFIRDFSDKIKTEKDDEVFVFQIRRKGDYSIFDSCDIHSICESEYYKHYVTLTRYLEEGTTDDIKEVIKSIRPYVEAILRYKFPLELEKAKNLGDMIRRIRESEPGSPLSRVKSLLAKLEDINDFASPFMHSPELNASLRVPTDTETRAKVELALKIGWGF